MINRRNSILCTLHRLLLKVIVNTKSVLGHSYRYSLRGSPHTSQISHLLLYPSLWLAQLVIFAIGSFTTCF